MKISEIKLDISGTNPYFKNDREILDAIEALFFSTTCPDVVKVEGTEVDLRVLEGLGTRYLSVKREDFLQFPKAWGCSPSSDEKSVAYVTVGTQRHPVRPDNPSGIVYARRIEQLGAKLSFRSLAPQHDQACLHAWMNNERVNEFWGM